MIEMNHGLFNYRHSICKRRQTFAKNISKGKSPTEFSSLARSGWSGTGYPAINFAL